MVDINEILSIIRENTTSIHVNKLDFTERLREQGIDSLDMISILFAIEESYQIKIPEEDLEFEKLVTIGGMLDYINARLK